jgi:hypothetical protein
MVNQRRTFDHGRRIRKPCIANYHSISSFNGQDCLDISTVVRKQQNTARLEDFSDVEVLT